MLKQKKWLIAIIIVVIAIVSIIGVIQFIFAPRNFSDISFEQKMIHAAEKDAKIDMKQLTDFEWDTMYYSWDGYLSENDILALGKGEKSKLRSTSSELWNHLLFVQNGELVRQVILSENKIELGMEPYQDNRDEHGTIKAAVFLKDEAVFNVEKENDTYIMR